MQILTVSSKLVYCGFVNHFSVTWQETTHHVLRGPGSVNIEGCRMSYGGRHVASRNVSHDWLKPQYINKRTMNPSHETIELCAKTIQ